MIILWHLTFNFFLFLSKLYVFVYISLLFAVVFSCHFIIVLFVIVLSFNLMSNDTKIYFLIAYLTCFTIGVSP